MKLFVPALVLGLACVAPSLSVRADDVPAQVQALVAKQAPAVVTVRAVLKISTKSAGAQATETRSEMQGVVVDPSGLIMVSSLPFSVPKMMEMMGAPPEAADSAPTITPTDFKVVFANETTEYPAFLAVSDATLGLSFLKISDLKGRTLTAVSFAGTATPALGDSVYALTRLGKGYDYAPVYESARVTGSITKPRTATMLDGGIMEIGLPVFSGTGEALGVLTSIPSGIKADSSAGMTTMLTRLLGGKSPAQETIFLVPASSINSVITQAQARAATLTAPVTPPAAPTTTPKAPTPAPAPAK